MSIRKPISISLSPNVEKDDVSLALRLLFQSWRWKHGGAIKKFEEEFKNYLGVKYAVSFNSGRSAFFAILKSLDLPKESNIGLQSFTCNAVPNPILWAGLNPVYIDCANDFNIDIGKLKERIDGLIHTNKPMLKVLVVQHTFGLPANMDEILRIAKENNLMVIEDCAHALGAELNAQDGLRIEGKKLGTMGKAAFFSFSRDKVISCVYGGMAVTNDDEIGRKLQKLQQEFGYSSGLYGYLWIMQQLVHPLLMDSFILPFYNFFNLGKLTLILYQWLGFLSKAVSWKEKRGLKPSYFPKALPNALAILALNQFKKLEQFNAHRKEIAEFYYKELKGTNFILPKREGNMFLRFAVQHPRAYEILYEAWHKEKILLGDWYTTPIAPHDTKMEEMKYSPGMCPNAEFLAKRTINLPTSYQYFHKRRTKNRGIYQKMGLTLNTSRRITLRVMRNDKLKISNSKTI